jgi:carboxymethylenebutenolidase
VWPRQTDDVAAKVPAEGGVADDQVVGDTEGAVQWLRVQPWTADLPVRGRVVMSKEELNPKQPVAPIEFTKDLSCPLLGLFGSEDRSPTPEQVNQHEAELKKHGKNFEFHRYDGAGHGFFYYDRPMYRIEQALDGWKKVFASSRSTWLHDPRACAPRSLRVSTRAVPARAVTGGSI